MEEANTSSTDPTQEEGQIKEERGGLAYQTLSKKRKYLVFSLANEKFAMPLSSVKEVIGLTDITPLMHVPNYFKGLINLRGRIISVIDLRVKLSLPTSEYRPKKTSIIISEFQGFVIGMIVDDVEAVNGFEESQLETEIKTNSKTNRDYLTGVAKTQERHLILLLDVSKILTSSEIVSFNELAKQVA